MRTSGDRGYCGEMRGAWGVDLRVCVAVGRELWRFQEVCMGRQGLL